MGRKVQAGSRDSLEEEAMQACFPKSLLFPVTLCLKHGALDVAILRQGTVEGQRVLLS